MAAIPFYSITKQYQQIHAGIDSVLRKTFRHGVYILGDNVSAFEHEFAKYLGIRFAVGVGSGTDALTLSIRALGLTTDDEVLVPANSYPTVFGVAQSGVSVRLVDCGPDGNISVTDVVKRITKRTRAIVVVHLYGNPADIVGVRKVLTTMGRSDIYVIEDCAQAHGAVIGQKKVGTFGDVACFSFYPTKNLGAYGDGGAVVTRSARLADRLRRLRMYGEAVRYRSTEVSGVSRLDELQAAVLRVKLPYLDTWNNKRKNFAAYYTGKLRSEDITILPTREGSCYHLFVIRSKKRDTLQTYLRKHHISTAIHFPNPIHMIPAFRSLGYRAGDFPVAETMSREVLSLPFFPELTKKEIDVVANCIHEGS